MLPPWLPGATPPPVWLAITGDRGTLSALIEGAFSMTIPLLRRLRVGIH